MRVAIAVFLRVGFADHPFHPPFVLRVPHLDDGGGAQALGHSTDRADRWYSWRSQWPASPASPPASAAWPSIPSAPDSAHTTAYPASPLGASRISARHIPHSSCFCLTEKLRSARFRFLHPLFIQTKRPVRQPPRKTRRARRTGSSPPLWRRASALRPDTNRLLTQPQTANSLVAFFQIKKLIQFGRYTFDESTITGILPFPVRTILLRRRSRPTRDLIRRSTQSTYTSAGQLHRFKRSSISAPARSASPGLSAYTPSSESTKVKSSDRSARCNCPRQKRTGRADEQPDRNRRRHEDGRTDICLGGQRACAERYRR